MTRRNELTPRKLIVLAAAIVVGLPLLFAAYFFGWFYEGLLYSGDGEYRRGVGEAAFQVAFPAVDLSRRGCHRYRFTRLGPSLDYVTGFRIVSLSRRPLVTDEDGRPDLPAANRPGALVAISLTNERKERVFAQVRRLSDWNWVRNMAEVNARTIERPIGGGSVQIERVGVGPDDGWGTHFKPRWRGTYDLEIEVLEPDSHATSLTAIPVMEGYVAWP